MPTMASRSVVTAAENKLIPAPSDPVHGSEEGQPAVSGWRLACQGDETPEPCARGADHEVLHVGVLPPWAPLYPLALLVPCFTGASPGLGAMPCFFPSSFLTFCSDEFASPGAQVWVETSML